LKILLKSFKLTVQLAIFMVLSKNVISGIKSKKKALYLDYNPKS